MSNGLINRGMETPETLDSVEIRKLARMASDQRNELMKWIWTSTVVALSVSTISILVAWGCNEFDIRESEASKNPDNVAICEAHEESVRMEKRLRRLCAGKSGTSGSSDCAPRK